MKKADDIHRLIEITTLIDPDYLDLMLKAGGMYYEKNHDPRIYSIILQLKAIKEEMI